MILVFLMEWAELGGEFQSHEDFPACVTVWGMGGGTARSHWMRGCMGGHPSPQAVSTLKVS
jgi:hypothetical protein